MKLEQLIVFWTMILESSVGNVGVQRDMAEKTLQMLRHLENVQELVASLAVYVEEKE